MIPRTRAGARGVERTAARLADIHGALLCSVNCSGRVLRMDFIMADQVIHVRIGKKWVEHFVPAAADREDLYRRVEQRLGPAALAGPTLNVVGRTKAGFTQVELDFLVKFRTRRS